MLDSSGLAAVFWRSADQRLFLKGGLNGDTASTTTTLAGEEAIVSPSKV